MDRLVDPTLIQKAPVAFNLNLTIQIALISDAKDIETALALAHDRVSRVDFAFSFLQYHSLPGRRKGGREGVPLAIQVLAVEGRIVGPGQRRSADRRPSLWRIRHCTNHVENFSAKPSVLPYLAVSLCVVEKIIHLKTKISSQSLPHRTATK